MPYTNIDDPSAYFQTVVYTGNGSTQSITNDGNSDLQPDWVWVKNRGATNGLGYHHQAYDSNRGTTKKLLPSSNAAEATDTNSLTAFNSDGFSAGSNVGINENAVSHVAWQWKCNSGTTSTNTDGDITSTVQANTDAGFSIVTYTGNTSNNQTVGHGLGVKPNVIIIRNRTRIEDWRLNHQSINNGTGMIRLNSTDAYNTTGTTLMNVAPTSSVFNVSTDFSVNGNYPFVAYCFAPKQGYSNFGKYVGNGNANGPFIYTGFKPAFVILKRTNTTSNWIMMDNKRNAFNEMESRLFPNLANAEQTQSTYGLDFLSNGFKLRDTVSQSNGSGSTYIYMAFAENPFVTSTGIPTTAR